MIGQAERIIELNRLKTQYQKAKSVSRGLIIAFSSGKGGTGKTFVTLNTACALSKLKKRVLVIDLDSNLSNINIMLNVKAEKTLINYFQNKAPLKDLISEFEPNLHFIYGDSGRDDYPISKDIDYLMGDIREIAQQYDYVFLDISSGAGEEIIYILKNADVNIIITNPEPTAIMDAYVIIKLLHNSGAESEKLVIINKCFSDEDGKVSFGNLSKAAQHFLGESIKLLGYIWHSKLVNKAVMEQELFIKQVPESNIAVQIMKIAHNLVKIKQVANNNHSK